MKLTSKIRGKALASLVAGSSLIAGGGIGVAAVAALSPAGALSVQVPAVAVREQNVNAAGRIRVALPKTSVGVNGSVSVSNLPLDSAGRLQTQNASGPWHQAFGGSSNVGSNPVTVASVTGAGVFKGFQLAIANATNGYANVYVTIYADGQVVFSRSVFAFICCWPSTPTMGAENLPNARSMWFYPPGGIRFTKSLRITLQQPNQNGGQSDGLFSWYTSG